MKFSKATKAAARGRIALMGPSGSGKTFTALGIASGLGDRVAVIDTERGSASKYADLFNFDVLELESFAPRMYVDAIRAATSEGYDVVVIDSLSHAWMGKGGALEMVDAAQRRSKAGNSFTAWRDVTPEHNALVDAIVQCPSHVIATMRTKTEYVLEEGQNGKKTPRRIGLAPVQRDGLEYEFDVVGEVDLDHVLSISKTRWSAVADQAIRKPGREFGERFRAWLTDGTPAPAARPRPEQAPVERTQEPAHSTSGADDDGPSNRLLECVSAYGSASSEADLAAAIAAAKSAHEAVPWSHDERMALSRARAEAEARIRRAA